MPKNIHDRLFNLKQRRSGIDRLDRVAMDEQIDLTRRSLVEEAWQKRTSATQPNTRYALGAMQEVDPDYTRISLETAARVQNQLDKDLTRQGFSVGFRLQGSVPLNVHIRGVSDVDLLTLDTSFITYSVSGIVSRAGGYIPHPTQNSSLGVIIQLRGAAAGVLKERFPTAKIDLSGGKAICIAGGSLARSVDVVPSHWHDNEQYQRTQNEVERTVTIADIKVPETIENLPFLHIQRIDQRDVGTLGGVKKAIRLCKNVKSDADIDIALPSFDIAAIIYHADQDALRAGAGYELNVLAETQRHLNYLATNPSAARELRVPDGSRYIFNTPAKIEALRQLSGEMDNLALEVAREQEPTLRFYAPNLIGSRAAISNRYIPN